MPCRKLSFYERGLAILFVIFVILPVPVAYLFYTINFALAHQHWGISDKPDVWGQFGDFMNFSVALSVGAGNLLLLGYLAYMANQIAKGANAIAEAGNGLTTGANELAAAANRIAEGANDIAKAANTLNKIGIETQLKFEIYKDFISKLDLYKNGCYSNRGGGVELTNSVALITNLAASAKEDFVGLVKDSNYEEFAQYCDQISRAAEDYERNVAGGGFKELIGGISGIRTLLFNEIKLETDEAK